MDLGIVLQHVTTPVQANVMKNAPIYVEAIVVQHVADVREHAPVVVTLHVKIHAMAVLVAVNHHAKMHAMPHVAHVMDVQEIAHIHVIHIARHHVLVIAVIAVKTHVILSVDLHVTASANMDASKYVPDAVQTAAENAAMDAVYAWDRVQQRAMGHAKFYVRHNVLDVRHLANSRVVQNVQLHVVITVCMIALVHALVLSQVTLDGCLMLKLEVHNLWHRP